jgi:hypothetical protein
MLTGLLAAAGCYNTPVDTSDYAQGPAPRRMASPAREDAQSYEDSLTGGQVFSMYCSYCHNAPALTERNFANFKNVATHMRSRANLTGKEYAQLMAFIRRIHDVPPPHPPTEASPKRFFFSQPIAEEKDRTAPLQPPGNPGLAPRETRNTPDAAEPQTPAIVPAKGSVDQQPGS